MKTSTFAPHSSIAHASSPLFARSGLALLLAITLGNASAGCMLSAEADVPDVEVTQHDIGFEGVPFSAAVGDVATHMSFAQKRPIDLPAALDSSVQAVKVELRAKKGIENFDFLRILRISMRQADNKGDAIELIDYVKTAGSKVGATLTIPSKNPINILEQWKADSAIFDVEVAGTLPEKAWTIDLSVHFSGKLSYKY